MTTPKVKLMQNSRLWMLRMNVSMAGAAGEEGSGDHRKVDEDVKGCVRGDILNGQLPRGPHAPQSSSSSSCSLPR